MNSQREAFEKKNPVPDGAAYNERFDGYYRADYFSTMRHSFNELYEAFQEGWQAATEQGDSKPDPVGTESAYEYAKDRYGNMTISCSLVVDLVEALRSSRKPPAEQGVGEPAYLCHQCEKDIGPPAPFKMYCWCTDCHVNTAASIARDLGRNHKPTEGGVPDGLIEFAKRCLAASRDGCGVDGAEIQDWALECGLIEPYQVAESCGLECACAEVSDFPVECYRNSALLATQQPKD